MGDLGEVARFLRRGEEVAAYPAREGVHPHGDIVTHRRNPPAAPVGSGRAEEDGEVVMGIIGWLIVGLIAGAVARAVWSGPDDLTLGQTLLVGLAGSLVGGFLLNLIGPGSIFRLRTAGIIGSIVGAIIVLGVYRGSRRRA
jgi:uncharacterized membrane protein YeaQ/YmgE (transglycosylase-associated protein family)